MINGWACPDCGVDIPDPKDRGGHVSACRKDKIARGESVRIIYKERPDETPEGMGWCGQVRCKTFKPIEMFTGENGRTYKTCVECRDRSRQEYAENSAARDRAQSSARRYYQSHKDDIEKTQKPWRDTHPREILDKRLRTNFNITLLQYEETLVNQDGVCAICEHPDPAGRRLCVDHNHSCCAGKRSCGRCVRGLICLTCNTALGNFHDDPDLLRRAIKYLERYQYAEN